MKIFMAVLALLCSLVSFDARADFSGSTTVIYVNGIMNTQTDAESSRQKIAAILNASVNHQGQNGTTTRKFNVTNVWNPLGWNRSTGCSSTSILDHTCKQIVEDQKELFLLKTAEEKYLGYLDSSRSPWNGSSNVSKYDMQQINQYVTKMMWGNTSLEKGDGAMPSTSMDGTYAAVQKLIATVRAAPSSVIVGHSEGNILANLSYIQLASEYGEGVSRMFRVVNVANTSLVSVNGLNLTHAGDAALYAAANHIGQDRSLESMPLKGVNGTISAIQRDTGYCNMSKACPFYMAKATFKDAGVLDVGNDGLAHDFQDIYLSNTYVAPDIDQGLAWSSFYNAGSTRFRDRFEDLVYAAAGSLPQIYGDEFEGPAPDATHWDFGQTAIWQHPLDISPDEMGTGVLETWMASTDSPGRGIESIGLPQVKHLRMSVRHRMTPSNHYFFPSINFMLANGQSFGVLFGRSDYGPDYCNDGNYYNVVRLNYWDGATACHFATGLHSTDLYGKWVNTIIDYDTMTGVITLDIDGGSAAATHYVATLPVNLQSPVAKFSTSTYGWWTGHHHDFDYIRATDVVPKPVKVAIPGTIDPGPTPIDPIPTDPCEDPSRPGCASAV